MIRSLILSITLALVSLESSEFIKNINKELKKVKYPYQEFRDQKVHRPFTVVYQTDDKNLITLISSQCRHNNPVQYVYYKTPDDAYTRFLLDTQDLISYSGRDKLKPFWDIRYINPVSKYIDGKTYGNYPNHGTYTGLDTRSGVNNIGIGTIASRGDESGSIVQLECINGILTGGTTINLYDAPEQTIDYAGPQTTFAYRLGETISISPWKSNGTGNLMLQGHFNKPLYKNYEKNIGGGVYIGIFIQNKHHGTFLNFVIGLYAAGNAWLEEKSVIQFDPTTNVVHVATVVSNDSWWSTKSPLSMSIEEVYSHPYKKTRDDQSWNDFYRVNISYKNLLAVLQELKENPPKGAKNKKFDLNPQDWKVTSVMIQYELEEMGGKATLSGSFRDFEVYLSEYPL